MKPITLLCRITRIGSAFFLAAMVGVTCLDVAGSLFLKPILGAEEMVSLMAALVLALSLPSSARERVHVGVDLLHRKLPPKWRTGMDAVVNSVSCILFCIVAVQQYWYARSLQNSGEVSTTLQFPYYLLVFVIAGAFLALSVVLGGHTAHSIRKFIRG